MASKQFLFRSEVRENILRGATVLADVMQFDEQTKGTR
jgi:hypothetical protein